MRRVPAGRIAATVWGVAALLVLTPARPGLAHASMVKSSPVNGARLSKAPSEVRAWFSEKLAVKGSMIRLEDSHMKVLASGGVDTRVKTLDVMAVKAPMLAAGTYTVAWIAVSDDDGATKKGAFKFTVGTAAMAPSGTTRLTEGLPSLKVLPPGDGATAGNPAAVVIETSSTIEDVAKGTV